MPFIVLEGLDGAGKSTQLNKLQSYLSEAGRQTHFLHFPRFDAPFYGELIARFLRGEFGTADNVDPYLVALLFAGDRADAAARISNWIERKEYVVTDRYVYSNIAFQCAKMPDRDSSARLARWILDLEFGHNKIPRPDISLFLDVPFEFTRARLADQRTGDDRSYLQGRDDIHESSLELQQKVREVYRESARIDSRLHIVDCSNGRGEIDTPDNNFGKIRELIASYI